MKRRDFLRSSVVLAAVGIGITRTIMPTYAQFAALEGALEQRGLAAKEIAAVLSGNYVRVLRESLR